MSRCNFWSSVVALTLATGWASPIWAETAGYTYVKMSLTVPWTLYFVFLGCVLIPFILMIVLAWRGMPKNHSVVQGAAGNEVAGGAP